MNNLHRQEYTEKPMCLHCVRGASSQTIFKFMTKNIKDNIDHMDYPMDLDDWERNRALLLCYPEWKERFFEMSVISNKWNKLVSNWGIIEKLYYEDYEKYGNDNYYNKSCDDYIRSLVS